MEEGHSWRTDILDFQTMDEAARVWCPGETDAQAHRHRLGQRDRAESPGVSPHTHSLLTLETRKAMKGGSLLTNSAGQLDTQMQKKESQHRPAAVQKEQLRTHGPEA